MRDDKNDPLYVGDICTPNEIRQGGTPAARAAAGEIIKAVRIYVNDSLALGSLLLAKEWLVPGALALANSRLRDKNWRIVEDPKAATKTFRLEELPQVSSDDR